jgi:uncharacterized radical SAM superfamily Fe-S cluster-containing enzyme
MPHRPYVFHDLTNSICSVCHRKVEAKIAEQEGSIYTLKRCPHHGSQRVLISTDAAYYRFARSCVKPAQLPLRFNTPVRYGCPYDCGLCPDHEQHGCLTLVEITDAATSDAPCATRNRPPHGRHTGACRRWRRCSMQS